MMVNTKRCYGLRRWVETQGRGLRVVWECVGLLRLCKSANEICQCPSSIFSVNA